MNINEVLQGLSNLGGEMQRVRSPKKIKKIQPGKKHKNFKEDAINPFPVKIKGRTINVKQQSGKHELYVDNVHKGSFDSEKKAMQFASRIIMVGEADQVKHSERLPKTVPPNTKHQSKHPYKGRLAEELRYVIYVGEEPKVHFGSEAEAKKWLAMFNVSGKASIRAVEDPNKRKPGADWIGLQKEAKLSEKATIPVSGYTDAYDFINDFWFYGHNPAEMVSWTGPRSNPTWFGIEDPKHIKLSKFLDDNGMDYANLYDNELEVVLWLAKKMNISPMTVLRYGNDSIRFQTDTIKAVKQKMANSKIKKEAEEPKADSSARAKLNHSLVSQGHKVQKDKKKELKKGAVKHKGKPLDEISKKTEYQEEFAILDAIRNTGKVNMAGAGVYLQDLFGHNKHKAREILALWASDKERHESINEGEERDIIANASKEKLIDMFLDSEDEYENRNHLENAVYNALTDLDVEDVVDPDMEVGGQRMGDFANGRVIDVISDSGKLIDEVMDYLNTDVYNENTKDPLNFPAKEIRAQYDRVKKDGYKPSTEFLLWLSKEKGFTMGDLEKIGDQRFYKTAQLYAEFIKATGKDPETNFPVKKPVYRQKELPLKMTPHQKEFDF
jgi:hypothetical protein